MTLKNLKPKQRIIETALNLFYKQGYLATGINQIIAEASVSKASFYGHFKSKEDLCVVYLEYQHQRWSEQLKKKIKAFESPIEKFMAPLAFLEEWLPQCQFRGCAFLNIASEITDSSSRIRQQAAFAKTSLKSTIAELTANLHLQHPTIDIDFITNSYYLLLEGTISACQVHSDLRPLEHARITLTKLIEL